MSIQKNDQHLFETSNQRTVHFSKMIDTTNKQQIIIILACILMFFVLPAVTFKHLDAVMYSDLTNLNIFSAFHEQEYYKKQSKFSPNLLRVWNKFPYKKPPTAPQAPWLDNLLKDIHEKNMYAG